MYADSLLTSTQTCLGQTKIITWYDQKQMDQFEKSFTIVTFQQIQRKRSAIYDLKSNWFKIRLREKLRKVFVKWKIYV